MKEHNAFPCPSKQGKTQVENESNLLYGWRLYQYFSEGLGPPTPRTCQLVDEFDHTTDPAREDCLAP